MAAHKKKQDPINLLPQNAFETSLAGRILKWVLTTFRVIVILVELVVIVGFLLRFWLDLKQSELNDEIKSKAELITSYSSFETSFKNTQKRLSVYSEYNQSEKSLLRVIDKIIKRLPADIKITSISKEADKIQIMAASLSEQSIAQFIVNLQSEPEFSNIKLTGMETKENSLLINFVLISEQKSDSPGGE